MPSGGAYSVSLKNSHTGETFSGVYRVGDKYLPEAFERINYDLRDFRADEIFPMDPRPIDIISAVHRYAGTQESYSVISGYRSPRTNANLRSQSRGVAKHSLHMSGQAIDVRLGDVPARHIREWPPSFVRAALDITLVNNLFTSTPVHSVRGKFSSA